MSKQRAKSQVSGSLVWPEEWLRPKKHSRSRPGLESQGWGLQIPVWTQDLEYVKAGEEVCYRSGQATWAEMRKPDTEDQGKGYNPGCEAGSWCFGLA